MGMLVIFSCSVQRILSRANTMVTKDTISFHLRKAIPTALHPYKQGVEVAGPLTLHGGDTGLGLAAIPRA
ncbi:MAG: hypothetical protein AUH05_12010 [Ktedonobacter sp. 13_2_20CM_53_11]|nr:MAG: hypothetical protein AUH05_12010 [Ktedonobacter sp. 13_2_20CM_53_11]